MNKRSMNRIIAINTAATAPTLSFAVNQRPIESGPWQQISPYGVFPNVRGQQRIDRASAEKMVAAFNEASTKAGRSFRGVPIFVGHPDVQPEKYPDKRRYGKITALEAREDGLYGQVAWNDLGNENMANGYYVYPSAAWFLVANSDGTHSPDELKSVGLTNDPNILNVQPWTANDKTAADAGGTTKGDNMPTWLIEMLGLKPEATEEEVKAALAALIKKGTDAAAAQHTAEAAAANERTRAEGLQSQLTAATTARAAAETLAANERTARAELMINSAITEGRVLPAERQAWVNSFSGDFDGSVTRLAAETKKLNTTSIELKGARQSIATVNERQAVIMAAVNERMTQFNESYDVAFSRVQADPQYAQVFAAMAATN